MLIFLSLILAAIIACAIEAADGLLDGSEFFGEKPRIHFIAVIAGASVGIMNFVIPKLAGIPAVALLLLAGILVFAIVLVRWWREEGTEFKELVPFLALEVILFFVAKAAAEIAALIAGAFIASVIRIVPTIAMMLTIIVMVYDLLQFRSKLKVVGEEISEEESKPESQVQQA